LYCGTFYAKGWGTLINCWLVSLYSSSDRIHTVKCVL